MKKFLAATMMIVALSVNLLAGTRDPSIPDERYVKYFSYARLSAGYGNFTAIAKIDN
jgi:hypothetical protein